MCLNSVPLLRQQQRISHRESTLPGKEKWKANENQLLIQCSTKIRAIPTLNDLHTKYTECLPSVEKPMMTKERAKPELKRIGRWTNVEVRCYLQPLPERICASPCNNIVSATVINWNPATYLVLICGSLNLRNPSHMQFWTVFNFSYLLEKNVPIPTAKTWRYQI